MENIIYLEAITQMFLMLSLYAGGVKIERQNQLNNCSVTYTNNFGTYQITACNKHEAKGATITYKSAKFEDNISALVFSEPQINKALYKISSLR